MAKARAHARSNDESNDVVKDNGRTFVKNQADFHPMVVQPGAPGAYGDILEQWQNEQQNRKNFEDLQKSDLDEIAELANIVGRENMSEAELRRALGFY